MVWSVMLGKNIKTKINEINVLITKALSCFNCKKYNESVSSLKLSINIIKYYNSFKYELVALKDKIYNQFLASKLQCTLKVQLKCIAIQQGPKKQYFTYQDLKQ